MEKSVGTFQQQRSCAEVKIGELLPSGSHAGTTKTLPEGMDKKQSHYQEGLFFVQFLQNDKISPVA